MLLAFALTLLAAVLLSELASRSVLSTAIVFLVVGLVLGGTGVVRLEAQSPGVSELIELALFAVLFTDAMKVGVRDLTRAWQLPGRALLLGLPMTLLATALLARLLVSLPWTEALLVGAILAPTDPVLCSAIIGREGVPGRLRHLLNVESGLNDGLALPVVLLLLAAAGGANQQSGLVISEELLAGIAVGIVLPWIAILLGRVSFLSAASAYEPIMGFAIALAVYAVGRATHANLFLAAFAAGVTLATLGPEVRNEFDQFGQLVTELLKLAALFVFGLFASPAELAALPIGGFVFAVLVLVVVRTVAVGGSLLGGGLPRRELMVAAWFGPKGFASAAYGLLVLQSGIERGPRMFNLVVLVILGSILVHSTTDHVVAERFRKEQREESKADPAVALEGIAPQERREEG